LQICRIDLDDGGKRAIEHGVRGTEKLGLEKIPVHRLAKEFEEIYFPGKANRCGLASTSGDKIVQRIPTNRSRGEFLNAQLRLKRIFRERAGRVSRHRAAGKRRC